MPPIDTSPQSVVRYLTRLLAAMCQERGGELRIRRSVIRNIEEENQRQLLCEDIDSGKDELVLRFGSKHSAVYPVEPECLTPKTSPPTSQPTSSPSSPQSRPPLSEEQLRLMEESV